MIDIFLFAYRPYAHIKCQPSLCTMPKNFSSAEYYSGIQWIPFLSSRRSESLQSVHFPTKRPFKEPRVRATPRRAMEKRTTSTAEDLDSGPPWLGLDWLWLAWLGPDARSLQLINCQVKTVGQGLLWPFVAHNLSKWLRCFGFWYLLNHNIIWLNILHF